MLANLTFYTYHSRRFFFFFLSYERKITQIVIQGMRIPSLISKTLPRFTPSLLSLAIGTRNMSSGSTQRVFQLRVDPLTGHSEWVVIEEGDEGGEIFGSAQQPLLAATSYLDMLNDSRRNRAYREAIDKTVTRPCHVLDIGYLLI